MNEIRWDAPEFEYQPKSLVWYTTSMLLAALLVGMGVWQRNVLFVAFVVIAEMLMLFWGNEKPRVLTFSLSGKELRIGEDKSYPLHDITEFSVDDEGGGAWVRFFLRRARGFAPLVRIHVPKQLAPQVRSFFGERFPEKEWEPSFSDTIEKLMRF